MDYNYYNHKLIEEDYCYRIVIENKLEVVVENSGYVNIFVQEDCLVYDYWLFDTLHFIMVDYKNILLSFLKSHSIKTFKLVVHDKNYQFFEIMFPNVLPEFNELSLYLHKASLMNNAKKYVLLYDCVTKQFIKVGTVLKNYQRD